MAEDKREEDQDKQEGLIRRVGPLEVDWPKAIGYYGGIGAAVALGFLEPPVAIFIAAIPLYKMLTHPKSPRPVRFVGGILEGASTPVGGDAEAAVRIPQGDQNGKTSRRTGILQEARLVADNIERR